MARRRLSISNSWRPTLQSLGAKSFDESWQNLHDAIETKSKELQHASKR
jgi:hypothetical protein